MLRKNDPAVYFLSSKDGQLNLTSAESLNKVIFFFIGEDRGRQETMKLLLSKVKFGGGTLPSLDGKSGS